ncbi:MAG: radical SAM protein [Clostridia bacterium]|nr:radical SAM protein [Clostridia bacterium]
MNEHLKNLKRIEFEITLACTGKCRHCSQGGHDAGAGHIDADIAVKAVREICANYRIESLMTFGGEPLLYPDVVCAIHRAATELGIRKRQVITNGYFTKNSERIAEVARNLCESGVNNLLLSVDAFHQETIPLEIVMYFAECSVKAGIPIKLQPAWLVSADDRNPYNTRTRELLKSFEHLNIPINGGNAIFPEGNALKYLSEYFEDGAAPVSPYEQDPMDVRAVSFAPNGDVLNGNIYEKSILEIFGDYRP